MPEITLNRGSATLPTVARDAIVAGQIFRTQNGRKLYAHLGSNGKMFSLNLNSKELASSRSKNKKVVLVGKFTYETSRAPGKGAATTRGAVKDGELFTVGAEPGALYAHIGRKGTGEMLSVNLVSGDIASTTNTRSAVNVVGTFRIDAKVAA